MDFSYQTCRLNISEIVNCNLDADFLISVMEILTPKVVENLPPYFQNVDSISSAKEWIKKITSDGRLFRVTLTDRASAIGFIFLSTQNSIDTHVGYLLAQSYWGKGYATEILKGLLDFIDSEDQITRLIAGVAADNVASIKLLRKLGFSQSTSEHNGTMFFEYQLLHKE